MGQRNDRRQMISEQQIMHKISQQPKRAATLKQLVREFGLHGAARNQLASQLRSMVSQGSLIHAPDDRFAIPQKAKPAAQGLEKNQASGRQACTATASASLFQTILL